MNPNPVVSTETQFRPGQSGNGRGRPSRVWIRRALNAYDKADPEKKTVLRKILDHQIEVATSWEVRIIGRDEYGTPIKVASGRDSTEAAKFLFGLIGLKPLNPGDEAVRVPSTIEVGTRPLIDVICELVRHRLASGQMTENELHKWTDTFLSIDSAKFSLVFKLLGKSPDKSPEEILALVDRGPTPAPQTVEAQPTIAPPTEEPQP